TANDVVESRRGRWPHAALDDDFVCRFPGAGELVTELKRQPSVGGSAERLIKTDGHLGRDPGLSIDHAIQCLARYAQHLRTFCYRKAERFEAVITHRQSRVRGFLHRHGSLL